MPLTKLVDLVLVVLRILKIVKCAVKKDKEPTNGV